MGKDKISHPSGLEQSLTLDGVEERVGLDFFKMDEDGGVDFGEGLLQEFVEFVQVADVVLAISGGDGLDADGALQAIQHRWRHRNVVLLHPRPNRLVDRVLPGEGGWWGGTHPSNLHEGFHMRARPKANGIRCRSRDRFSLDQGVV